MYTRRNTRRLGRACLQSILLLACSSLALAAPQDASSEYAAVQARLQQGWNTWDTNTVIGQVLLPQGLEIRLGLKRNSSENSDAYLGSALIGRQGKDDEQVFPGPHTYDGAYTELRLSWRGVEV